VNHDEKLLMNIHKNAEMGRATIDRLLDHVTDGAFKGMLASQQEEYSRVFIASDVLLKSVDGDDSGIPAMARVMSDMMIDMKTMLDKSHENMARMVLKGTQMGLDELERDMDAFYDGASKEIQNLANAFYTQLSRNRRALLRYIEKEEKRQKE